MSIIGINVHKQESIDCSEKMSRSSKAGATKKQMEFKVPEIHDKMLSFTFLSGLDLLSFPFHRIIRVCRFI